MVASIVATFMIVLTLITIFIPFKFDNEISSVLYYGYEDLEVTESVIKKNNFYNFGHYSMRLRFLTIDIESISKDKVVWSSPIEYNFPAYHIARALYLVHLTFSE